MANRIIRKLVLKFFQSILLFRLPLPFGVLVGQSTQGCCDGGIVGNKPRYVLGHSEKGLDFADISWRLHIPDDVDLLWVCPVAAPGLGIWGGI